MVFCDPPYNISYSGGSKKRDAIENDNLGSNFYQFLLRFYACARAAVKPGASIYVTHADTERVSFTRAFIESGFHFSSVIIWVKNNSTFGRQDYFWKHEPILYGWHDGGPHTWHGPNTEDTVWAIDRPSKSDEHPTKKPVALVARAITNSSERGEIVLDLFLGSGTTICAAEQTGRIGYGCEIDPKYADVVVARWQELTGKVARNEEGRSFADVAKDRLGEEVTAPAV